MSRTVHPSHHNTQSRSDAAWLWNGELPPEPVKAETPKKPRIVFGKKKA